MHSVENPGNAAKETLVSRKIELVFAAFFALFFIGWLTFDIPVALGFVYKGPPGTRARSTRSSAIRRRG